MFFLLINSKINGWLPLKAGLLAEENTIQSFSPDMYVRGINSEFKVQTAKELTNNASLRNIPEKGLTRYL
jgi:hypothetical protein